MDERVLVYSFGENFIQNLATFLVEKNKTTDFSKFACVFGGRRPMLFLNKALSKILKTSFIPPKFFSSDEFIDYILKKKMVLYKISELEASFLIYNLVKEHVPSLLKGREKFSEFLSWAIEIVSFIEQLDLEDIPNQKLMTIQKSALIGYDVPDSINFLLRNLITIRELYHKNLEEKKTYSRGLRYLKAATFIDELNFDEFAKVLFCNFFYLHTTEKKIIKSLLEKDKAICIFEGSQKDWSVLEKNASYFGFKIIPQEVKKNKPNILIYKGFDLHSQVCIARTILSDIREKDSTVIVLPQPQSAIPLLVEISSFVEDFNVSMGYPLKRSSIYCLLMYLLKAQETKKGKLYYTKDYINLLLHPMLKNLKIQLSPLVTEVLVDTLVNFLEGKEESSISGSIFVELTKIEEQEVIFSYASKILVEYGLNLDAKACKDVLVEIHRLFFNLWENIDSFHQFADNLEYLIDFLFKRGPVSKFSYNIKVLDKVLEVVEEFRDLSFSNEKFDAKEIWDIFKRKLEGELISFSGSPLKGLQIIGLFETRSLNFENVIFIDVNESVLPKLKIYEPLIPREVMLNLGLDRLEKEEEIQRYQFMRLIHSAKNVYLIYIENQQMQKSRFLEELIWEKQKEEKKLEIFNIPKASFKVQILTKNFYIEKTDKIIEFLKVQKFSPTYLDKYLECPMSFYFDFVLGLKEEESLLDGLESKAVGNFLHNFLQEVFSRFENTTPLINREFENFFMKKLEDDFKNKIEMKMHSDALLLKTIVKTRMKEFLESEKEREVLKIICLERQYQDNFDLPNLRVEFIYRIDRIDQLKDESFLIIDYKTGDIESLIPRKLKKLESIEFDRDSIKENIRSFQLPLYYYFISKQIESESLNAAFYSLRTCEIKSFIHKEDFSNKEKIIDICIEALRFILQEIFDINTPFLPARQERSCSFCAYKFLCK